MRRIVIILACACAALVNAGAQEADLAEARDSSVFLSEQFRKNWEVHLHAGVQNYLAEYTRANTINDLWCPGFDFNINRWASPGLGFGLGANVAGYKGLYTYRHNAVDSKTTFADFASDSYYDGGHKIATGTYGNIFAKAMFNATNLLSGYNPKRIFELTGYLGGGLIFPMSRINYKALGATFNAGLNLQFRVTQRLLVDLSVRGAVISDGFNGISYLTSPDIKNIPLDGMIGATAGIAYRFGFEKKKSPAARSYQATEPVPAPVPVSVPVPAPQPTVIPEAESTVEKVETEKIITEIKKESPYFWIHVAFEIDKWFISNNEKVNVMAAAEYINSCPDQTFYVRGYADMQTSNPEHNQTLSENRAHAVRDMLVQEFDVNPDQLIVECLGGVDFMFYKDPMCSRSVIISSK